VTLSSMKNQQRTGDFVETNFNIESMNLSTPTISKQKAVYVADMHDVPGKLVAECLADTGTSAIYLDDAQGRRERAKFIVGTITQIFDDGFSLKDYSGRIIRVKIVKESIVPEIDELMNVIVELDTDPYLPVARRVEAVTVLNGALRSNGFSPKK
jgi:hypothetical protein